jgi:pimeloyl-ACP methyl ester carboxylesterase
MFDEFKTFDARRLGTCFEVPFFLFQGESDVITLTSLAEEYFTEVEAPVKEMALIRNAGHFAAFTQPEQFLAALLKNVLPLASAPAFDISSSPSQPANLNQR